jgi:hypothetical protein
MRTTDGTGGTVVHCITIELNGIRLPDETARIEESIKALGPAYMFTKGVWFVESERSNHEISATVAATLRAKDRLIVSRVNKDWVSANVTDQENEWLGSRNFTAVGDPPLFRR